MVAIVAITVALGWALTTHTKEIPDFGDSRDYASSAWNLVHSHVFSQSLTQVRVKPGTGREPGYPVLLAAMMSFVPDLEGITPACLLVEQGCSDRWRPVLYANSVMIGLTGICVFVLVHLLDAGRLAAWLAGAHIWLNGEGARNRGYVLSDNLALLLIALASVVLVWAWRSGGGWRWMMAGLAVAALVLTKAVFFWCAVFGIAAGLCATVALGTHVRRGLFACTVFALAFFVPVGSWMARNAAIGGSYAISTGRTAIALSTREVFNHMSPAQYAAAFVYWTRGFGDGLARSLFPESVWGPFEIDRKDGFYAVGQLRLNPEFDALIKDDGLSVDQADNILSRRMIGEILDHPVAYVASTAPLIWRGIWVDEFIVISLPALFWLLWARARKRADVVLAIAPGLFSLTFYPLVSLNIPRYQMTALPALAVAFGIGLSAAASVWRERRSVAVDRRALKAGTHL
jgi:4-amino-4-deoxy-L-arabinose transferase-like glycosyltransferase